MFSKKYKHKKHSSGLNLGSTNNENNPWSLHDTRYLKHLKEQLELRKAYEGSLRKRNELLESNKRQNYQLEIDRLTNELHKPNLPHSTKEHMEQHIEKSKKKRTHT